MTPYARRRAINFGVMGLAIAATLFGLLWLVLVLGTLLVNGVGALGPVLFTHSTPPPGSNGGLDNAIFGSLVLPGLATLVGRATGALAGPFLAAYARARAVGALV